MKNENKNLELVDGGISPIKGKGINHPLTVPVNIDPYATKPEITEDPSILLVDGGKSPIDDILKDAKNDILKGKPSIVPVNVDPYANDDRLI
jgi:hypothetical protein